MVEQPLTFKAGGRPSLDRTWVECFAQLVGTVLSLWDAAALDAASEDGEVVPMFINLSDASIKMVRRYTFELHQISPSVSDSIR